MEVATSLRGHLLIAMPRLDDPNFEKSVALICEHSDEGALGIVINRPLDEVLLGEVFNLMRIRRPHPATSSWPVYSGGPVERERGFIVHRPLGDWEASIAIDDRIGVTTSLDILRAIAKGAGPRQALVTFGYAGWGPGQLEMELRENSWGSAPVDPRVLFDVPCQERWRASSALLGVDLAMIPEDAGHA